MRRRDLIGLLGGAAAWPLATSARSAERERRIGVVMSIANEQEGQSRIAAFRQKLRDLEWMEGRNVRIDVCWSDGDARRAATCAAELVGSAPDVILASGPESLTGLRRE